MNRWQFEEEMFDTFHTSFSQTIGLRMESGTQSMCNKVGFTEGSEFGMELWSTIADAESWESPIAKPCIELSGNCGSNGGGEMGDK